MRKMKENLKIERGVYIEKGIDNTKLQIRVCKGTLTLS